MKYYKNSLLKEVQSKHQSKDEEKRICQTSFLASFHKSVWQHHLPLSMMLTIEQEVSAPRLTTENAEIFYLIHKYILNSVILKYKIFIYCAWIAFQTVRDLTINYDIIRRLLSYFLKELLSSYLKGKTKYKLYVVNDSCSLWNNWNIKC